MRHNITAIWLVRTGMGGVEVRIEIGGEWFTVIREAHDSPFSHIVESDGIDHAIRGGHEVKALEERG